MTVGRGIIQRNCRVGEALARPHASPQPGKHPSPLLYRERLGFNLSGSPNEPNHCPFHPNQRLVDRPETGCPEPKHPIDPPETAGEVSDTSYGKPRSIPERLERSRRSPSPQPSPAGRESTIPKLPRFQPLNPGGAPSIARLWGVRPLRPSNARRSGSWSGSESVSGSHDPTRWVSAQRGRRDSLPMNLTRAHPSPALRAPSPLLRRGESIHEPPSPALSSPEPVAAVAALCERRVAAASARRTPRSAVTDRRYRSRGMAGVRGALRDGSGAAIAAVGERFARSQRARVGELEQAYLLITSSLPTYCHTRSLNCLVEHSVSPVELKKHGVDPSERSVDRSEHHVEHLDTPSLHLDGPFRALDSAFLQLDQPLFPLDAPFLHLEARCRGSWARPYPPPRVGAPF